MGSLGTVRHNVEACCLSNRCTHSIMQVHKSLDIVLIKINLSLGEMQSKLSFKALKRKLDITIKSLDETKNFT